MTAAEVAIERAPGLKENWVRKARCLAALDRGVEERLACWERVAELDPEDSLAWNSQELVLSELGRYEDALHASQRAVELEQESSILNRNYGSLLAFMGRHREARTYNEKALSLSGEATTASDWVQRGSDLCELDRRNEALDAYRKAVEPDPHRTAAWDHLEGVLKEQCRFRLRHRITSRMAELLPAEAYFHSYLGHSHADLGQFEEALAAYESALKLDPELDQKGEPASFSRGLMLNYLGRDREALEALEQCKPQESKIMQFQYDLAHAGVLLWLGRREEGRAELDRLLGRDQPPLWTGRALEEFVRTLLVKSPNPEIWKQFIKTWLASFESHQRLAELGQALVRSLRVLNHAWISDRTAHDWYKTWKELAGGIEEMALPLRLLGAGVEYSGSRDPRALLGLAREERGLLDPWLVNLLEEEPAEIDDEMEALLLKVEQRLAEQAPKPGARRASESHAST